MTNIYNNNNIFKYSILIMIAPIIGILTISSLAFMHIQDEINTVNHQIKGLHRVNQLQNIIFNIQQLRGLSNIIVKDKKCYSDVKKTKDSITNELIKLKTELSNIPKNSILKKRLLAYIDNVINHLKHDIAFDHLSSIIQDSIIILEHISHHSELILDAQLQSYILMETVVSILPELIEYNGQIRGVSSSVHDKLDEKTRHTILTQLSKISDRMSQLEFNMSQLNNAENSIIATIYKNMLNAQNSLISFTENEILKKDKIMINSEDIFRLNSNNIEFITLLYKTNSKELKDILTLRLDTKKNILLFIALSGLASILFIIYINTIFFNKNKEFIRKIELLSITDSMTNLYNRRHFDMLFDKQRKVQLRLKKNLVFIMMDIDHFKQYNDTYGHQAGDDTLIAVASCIKGNLHRPDDFAFRLGGEEFGVLCNDMTKEESFKFANKLKESIEDLNIEHSGNSASEFVTISMGLIVIEPKVQCDNNNIYKCADEALYNAKELGRNQVSIYEI